ncbi:MAG: NAD-dependent epimerase/dehydratase family protein [Dokdonella sp.]
MPLSLMVGASGATGRFLRPRLLAAGHQVIALSRRPYVGDESGVRWLVGDLHATMPPLPALDAIFSLGPLDAFARWFAQAPIVGTPHVIAFSSMSVDSKRGSSDTAERRLAERLRSAELELAAAAERRGCAWTVFRPTLIYGAGVDRSLTPIARLAMRWRLFPRLVGARGLRQPVHADDLATACIAVLENARSHGRIYALGGGERLAFETMLERVRRSLPTIALPLPLPLGLARVFARALHSPRRAALARLLQDLVADNAAAAADFGWSPRAFDPDASAWIARD